MHVWVIYVDVQVPEEDIRYAAASLSALSLEAASLTDPGVRLLASKLLLSSCLSTYPSPALS